MAYIDIIRGGELILITTISLGINFALNNTVEFRKNFSEIVPSCPFALVAAVV